MRKKRIPPTVPVISSEILAQAKREAHPDKLPPGYVDSLSASPVHRVVCDYIAGMTDGFFLRSWESSSSDWY